MKISTVVKAVPRLVLGSIGLACMVVGKPFKVIGNTITYIGKQLR